MHLGIRWTHKSVCIITGDTKLLEIIRGTPRNRAIRWLLKWTQSQGEEGSYQTLGDAITTIFGEELYSKYVKIVLNSEEGPMILTPHTQ